MLYGHLHLDRVGPVKIEAERIGKDRYVIRLDDVTIFAARVHLNRIVRAICEVSTETDIGSGLFDPGSVDRIDIVPAEAVVGWDGEPTEAELATGRQNCPREGF